MKKIILLSGIALTMFATACNDDFRCADTNEGEGKILLRPVINSDITVMSRAGQADDQLAENAIIWISNNKGVVRKYKGIGQMPASGIALVSDDYIAEVWAGDSVSASFDHIYYKGSENFKVSAGTITQVDVECRIANVVVEVKYDEAVDEALTDYGFTVSHRRGSLTFSGREDENRPGYFMMPSSDPNLKCVLTGTKPDGSQLNVEKIIENAKPTTKYILHVTHGGPVSEDIGGAIISVKVEEEPLETIEDNSLIFAAPTVEGTNFDITKPILGQEGALDEKKLWIKTTSPFKKVEIRGDEFGSIFGIGGDDFEILAMDDNTKAALSAKGFSYQLFSHEDEGSDCQEMKIIFHEDILNSYKNGEHKIDVLVVDSNDKQKYTTITVILSDAKVKTDAIKDVDVWATTATLQATAMKADQTGVGFKWRKKGDAEWTFTAVTAADNAAEGTPYSVVLTDLQPATDYQYMAVCDGFETADILSFTTEAAAQLPNAGFEDWNTSSTPYLIYAAGGEMFWDSGNHGSATMSKNITTPSTDLKHSGNYSIKLESQFVGLGAIGKFAAGNVFIGQYLATEGTDGQLGWGRPFTSRPKALKGYVKYTPQAITYADPAAPKSKGDMDEGIIYIAIVDGSTKTADAADKDYVKNLSQKQWPVIVKTKASKRTLFSKDDANVIAYGEKVFTAATAGDALIEFEIPIEYYHKDLKACNIIITCSASRYGDYFTGGPSVMYLDDIQLVY